MAWQSVMGLDPRIISIFSRHSRMLKKSASGVLDSSKSSTGTRPPHHSAARTDVVLLIRRTVRPRGYASGFDSPAALLNGLSEHPARAFSCWPHVRANEVPAFQDRFSVARWIE